MRRILALGTIAIGILWAIPDQASAWTCLAAGAGHTASGFSLFRERARNIALRHCDRRAVGVCTIQWCRH